MPDYKRMYFKLAARVADAIELLVDAQQEGENDYTNGEPAVELVQDCAETKESQADV